MAVISKRYFLERTLQSLFMIWVAVTVLFFLFRLMPGDFTALMMYQGASEEAVQSFRAKWGLDDPLHIQYFRYITNLAQADAGTSLNYQEPVIEVVKMRIFNSFILVAPGITLGYLVGSAYGLVAGTKRGSKLERYGIVPLVFVGSFPSFFIAIMLVVIFASWLGWFPTSGMIETATRRAVGPEAPWWEIYLTKDFLMHFILPFTAVFLRYLFLPALIMRTSVIEVQGRGFSYFQRVVGYPKLLRIKKLAKHASLPVITLYPVSMTRAIGGLVLVEAVFNWPGIGSTLIEAVLARDFPILMFVFFLLAVFIILANFLVDITYGVIDPRVTVGE